MKRSLVVLVAGLMFLSFTSRCSYAEPCCPSCSGGMDFPPPFMPMMHHVMDGGANVPEAHPFSAKRLRDLGLDDKQREAIKEINNRMMKDAIRKGAELGITEIELKDILDKDSVDLDAAGTTLKKIESLKTDLRLARIRAMEEIKARLTPEQRKKFKEPPVEKIPVQKESK